MCQNARPSVRTASSQRIALRENAERCENAGGSYGLLRPASRHAQMRPPSGTRDNPCSPFTTDLKKVVTSLRDKLLPRVDQERAMTYPWPSNPEARGKDSCQ